MFFKIFKLLKFIRIMANVLNTIKYQLKKVNNPDANNNGKYYAQNLTHGTVGIDELCEHISNHGSLYDRATVQGVIMKLVDCITELLAQSYKVKLGELGTFYNTLCSEGVFDPKEFDPEKHIKGVNLRFLPNRTKVLNGKFNNAAAARKARMSFELAGIDENDSDKKEQQDAE